MDFGYKVTTNSTAAITIPSPLSSSVGRCVDLCRRAPNGTCASVNFDKGHRTCFLQTETKAQAVEHRAFVGSEAFENMIHMEMICTGKQNRSKYKSSKSHFAL